MSTVDPTLLETPGAVSRPDRPSVEPVSSPNDRPYRFTADDFYRMIDRDIFPDEARVGLWEGQVYEEMGKKQAHSLSWSKLNAALLPRVPPGWCLWAECSITISPDKAPLPDMVILRGVADDYDGRRPVAGDIGLVIELADSSLKIDTGAKLVAYARAGIAVYWVLNLKDNVVHVYADPVPAEGRYASTTTIGRDGSIPFVLDGVQVALIPASALLPGR